MPRQGRSRREVRIAVMLATDYGYTRRIIRGAAEACIEFGLSTMLVDPRYRPLPDPRRFGFDGVIVSVYDLELAAQLRGLGVPVINISARLGQCEFPSVFPDNHRIGEIAAEHLLSQKARTFAVHRMDARFGSERLEGFRETIERAGHDVHDFAEIKDFIPDDAAAFLRSCRKPVGFFSMTDLHASHVLRVLSDARLTVPRDVQIVGVDNDELICLMSNPRLSSVDGNFELVGRSAVQLLHSWIVTGRRPPEETVIAPAGLVMRQSSDLSTTDDELVNQALQIIRTEGHSRLSVKQLIRRLATSRRNLELRFREVLGSTPAREILRVQVDRACQLLIDTELSLSRVAESSGLGYERQLRTVFRRMLGITPSGYRKQFRQGTSRSGG